MIIDGRNSTTAQLAASYLSVMAQDYMAEKAGAAPAVTMRFLYNPNNITQWFIMPGLIVMLSMLQVIVLASLSVAREREQGTFEQLLVAPFSLDELGDQQGDRFPLRSASFKARSSLPSTPGGLRYRLRQGVVKVYVVLLIFILSIVGLGLAISAYSRTMQQALLIAFVLLVPMVLLGGLFTPVANMPEWLQLLTYADPLRFALAAVRRIYLADAGYEEILLTMWPAIVVAAGDAALGALLLWKAHLKSIWGAGRRRFLVFKARDAVVVGCSRLSGSRGLFREPAHAEDEKNERSSREQGAGKVGRAGKKRLGRLTGGHHQQGRAQRRGNGARERIKRTHRADGLALGVKRRLAADGGREKRAHRARAGI